MPIVQERSLRATSAHDRAGGGAGTPAVSLGASGRGALRSPQLSHRCSGGDGNCARLSSAESSDFSFSVRPATEQGPGGKGTKNRRRTRRYDSSETVDRRGDRIGSPIPDPRLATNVRDRTSA